MSLICSYENSILAKAITLFLICLYNCFESVFAKFYFFSCFINSLINSSTSAQPCSSKVIPITCGLWRKIILMNLLSLSNLLSSVSGLNCLFVSCILFTSGIVTGLKCKRKPQQLLTAVVLIKCINLLLFFF